MNAEQEILELLVKTCRSIRNPKNPRHRLELAVPAAQWEIKFQERLQELRGNEQPSLPGLPRKLKAAA